MKIVRSVLVRIFLSSLVYFRCILPVLKNFEYVFGQTYALKQQNKEFITKEKMQKAILNEMIVMQELKQSPNVARLHEAFEDKLNVYFVMDYCGYVMYSEGQVTVYKMC